jgi:transcriptional regulator with XRE-family HTH domain
MNETTVRFIAIYNYLLEIKKVSNASDFAKQIGVSNSLINEILKGRSNVGVSPIQNTVKVFNTININWLMTGQGDMLTVEGEKQYWDKFENDVLLLEKDKLIKLQAEMIATQNKLIAALEDKLGTHK